MSDKSTSTTNIQLNPEVVILQIQMITILPYLFGFFKISLSLHSNFWKVPIWQNEFRVYDSGNLTQKLRQNINPPYQTWWVFMLMVLGDVFIKLLSYFLGIWKSPKFRELHRYHRSFWHPFDTFFGSVPRHMRYHLSLPKCNSWGFCCFHPLREAVGAIRWIRCTRWCHSCSCQPGQLELMDGCTNNACRTF